MTPRDLLDGRIVSAAAATAILALTVAAGPTPVPAPASQATLAPTGSANADAALDAVPVVVETPTPDPWAETAERCGAGRWAVRTLGDRELSRVDFATTVSARVADLAGVRRPLTDLPAEGRVGPLETTLFAVTARLLEARLTPEDELQVAIADQKGSATLVVTMPGADCLARTPAALRTRIVSARDGFALACGPFSAEWAPVSGEARIVAPGYWAGVDPSGPASNGLQLSAPVAVELSGSCGSGGPASPSPPAEPALGAS